MRQFTPLITLTILLALVATGCSTGSYPVDIFQEMHYQESYHVQEPDRLDIPESAVPYYPVEPRMSGDRLFIVNCSMCHGTSGRGDGKVLKTMEEKHGYVPVLDPDLSSGVVQAQSDDALYNIISNGVQVMPQFEKLLTPEERRLIVDHVRSLSSGMPPATPAPTQAVTGAEPGASLAAQNGCTACHSTDGSAGVGPTWKGLFGSTETMADGSIVTADEEYLRESIMDPNAKVVEGFLPGMMPTHFGTSLSEEEINAIIEYIKTLE